MGTAQRKRQVRRVWVRVRVTARAGAGARVEVRGSGRGEGEVSVRVKGETGWSATTVDGHVEVASRVRGRLQRQPLGRRLRHRLCGRERRYPRYLSLVVRWRGWSLLHLRRCGHVGGGGCGGCGGARGSSVRRDHLHMEAASGVGGSPLSRALRPGGEAVSPPRRFNHSLLGSRGARLQLQILLGGRRLGSWLVAWDGRVELASRRTGSLLISRVGSARLLVRVLVLLFFLYRRRRCHLDLVLGPRTALFAAPLRLGHSGFELSVCRLADEVTGWSLLQVLTDTGLLEGHGLRVCLDLLLLTLAEQANPQPTLRDSRRHTQHLGRPPSHLVLDLHPANGSTLHAGSQTSSYLSRSYFFNG